MAHYYGEVEGSRGPIHRLGTRGSGMRVTAAQWEGAVTVRLHTRNEREWVTVERHPWHGSDAVHIILYDGPLTPNANDMAVMPAGKRGTYVQA